VGGDMQGAGQGIARDSACDPKKQNGDDARNNGRYCNTSRDSYFESSPFNRDFIDF